MFVNKEKKGLVSNLRVLYQIGCAGIHITKDELLNIKTTQPSVNY